MAEVEGLLVKVRTGAGFGLDAVRAFGDAEPILEVPPGTPNAFGVGAAEPAMWLKVASDGNAWDRAHSLLAGGYAADSSGVVAAEPDMGQSWVAEPSPKTTCQAGGQDKSNGRAAGPRDGWHLDDAYSGLRTARASVSDADQAKVTIAHLDTGWDPKHAARPRNVRLDKQINFTGEGARNDALDVTPKTGIFNRGHGPATVGLLAGGDPGFPIGGVSGPLGGAPGCQVIPIRIADSVVRLTTSTMVKGFKHALDCGADVLSMSMGGLASDAVADAINRCYEQGMVVVTAAGNFMPKIPTPRSIVYPARMRRVLAATGVMADGSPYFGGALTTMQGCHGPASKMETALAGWTPNAPWVELGCVNVIDYDGSGTSAATPQVAATAALWIAKYHAQLEQYPKRWMRGEAARQALLQSARKTTAKLNQAQVRTALGAGAINAVAALALAPMKWDTLRSAPPASADWAWLKLLSGEGVGVAPIGSPRARMLGLELLQVVQLDPTLEELIEDPDADGGGPSEADRKGFLEAVRDSEASSRALKGAIDRALGKSGLTGPRTLPPAPQRGKAKAKVEAARPRPPAPGKRRLRIFALDPSLGGTLDLVDSKIATVDVRYEKDANGDSILRPGPVGEYLEVVDVDPASDQFYPPVDLDDPRLLLQDGLEPSEGNPAFHQQMVYAVGMRTIASFEQALGRRALWSPHRRDQGAWEYVPRLRLYPHALRARNAYYSPNLVSILFGYFPAESDRQDATAPGTLVFGCLSADIVAHEMTHALLDGYTRGYRESSNPDVGAFHEAFADIVALFQHFQYRDLIRREIARARGDLNAATLLGELARQFGEGISKRGALRDYLAENEDEYSTTFEVHDRGALLVKAIYEAFLAIFTRRTGDLIRLATGGSGVLEPGEIHPDLVDRLTDEACKAAGHVLRMCIRAIDYLPPIDVTFGAYLRALITADVGQVEDDRFGYRTALIQAFRRRDLLPGNLRTVSVETLTWSAPREKAHKKPPWLARAVEVLKVDWLHTLPRWKIYSNARDRCFSMHQLISEELERDPETIAKQLGLELGVPLYDKDGAVAREAKGKTTFEVRNVRAARRQRPDGQLAEEIIVTLAQRRPEPLDGHDVRNGFFWYRGGATLVINPSNDSNEPEIKYLIWKRLGDSDRLARERAFRGYPPTQTTRSLYFGARGVAGDEPFAMLHSAED